MSDKIEIEKAVNRLYEELTKEMSFTKNYRDAKANVQEALNCVPLEARLWLEHHCKVVLSGTGIHSKIKCNSEEGLDRLEKLAGPHGRTLVKIIEARNK